MLVADIKKQLGTFSLEVDFAVEQGLTVVLGPSGCGKSTLLNVIAGLIEPDSGEIVLGRKLFYSDKEGKKANLPVHQRKVGYVFQQPSLFPHLTVRENIAYGINKGTDKNRIDELVELLRLSELQSRYPSQISGGQAQRVTLARALVTDPQLFLLDEPFSSLDNFVRQKIRRDLLKLLQHYSITAVLVTHDLDEAMILADNIAVMDGGRILQYDKPKQVFTRPSNRKVARFVGMRNIYSGIIQRVVNGQFLVIKGEKFEVKTAYQPFEVGQKVLFGIRPEDVLYLRPERMQNFKENTFSVSIVSVIAEGAFYRLLLRITRDTYDFEMLLPRHVVEKRGLVQGKNIMISFPYKSLHLFS